MREKPIKVKIDKHLEIPVITHDGGMEAEGFAKIEVNNVDCAVRAIAIAAGMEYPEAHKMLKKAGRRDDNVFRTAEFMKHKRRINGYKVTKVESTLIELECYFVSDFVKQYNKGRYLVRYPGHVFAVIDGVLIDSAPTFRHFIGEYVSHAWKFQY